MSVRLTSITKPVLEEIPDTQSLLAHHARVSNTANQLNHETGAKLLASLIKRNEWSPLEMCDATFEIKTTRDIARQMLRHRSFSFQEFSQRYAKVEADPIYREARLQDNKDRQNSIEVEDDSFDEWRDAQQEVWQTAIRQYEWALSQGIAKEVARAILPEGLTVSTLYMKGSIRSWIHYFQLRCDPKTQKEHRLLALEMRGLLVQQLPSLAFAFSDQA
jgi:thymidylate synthase (FAD)